MLPDIDNTNLSALSDFLSFSSSNVHVRTRIESYSCKPIAKERKMYRALESDLVADMDFMSSVSPPHHEAMLDSAFGPLDQKANRKTYLLLISTLNSAFPDHNFSSVRADEFVREPSPRSVLSSFSSNLSQLTLASSSHRHIVSSSPGTIDGANVPIHPRLRDALDPIIGLDECEVYSYMPDADSDPYNANADLSSDDEPAPLDDFEMDMYPNSSGRKPSLGGDSYGENESIVMEDDQEDIYNNSSKSYYSQNSLPSYQNSLNSNGIFPTDFDEDEDVDVDSLGGGDDEEEGGLLWSANYFFHNRKMKRIVFISVCGRKTSRSSQQHDFFPVLPKPTMTLTSTASTTSPIQHFIPLVGLHNPDDEKPAFAKSDNGTTTSTAGQQTKGNQQGRRRRSSISQEKKRLSSQVTNPIRTARRNSRIKASNTQVA